MLYFFMTIVLSRNLISRLAKYADYSYSIPKEINKFGILNTIDPSIHGRVIAIRGSIDHRDWLDNFYFCLDTDFFFKGHIHSGYLNRVREIVRSCDPCIDDSVHTVYLTGHSSGAAKSLILGNYLATLYKKKTFIVLVFGIPVFCDDIFIKNLKTIPNLKVFSIVIENDVIAQCGYGTPFKSVKINSASKNCFNKNLVEIHSMENYVRSIKMIL